jgi:hypothetical protein
MSGRRANTALALADKDEDGNEKKRKKTTKRRRRRENGGALEWKDIVVGKTKSMSSCSHSSEEEEEKEKEGEDDEGKDLDALMKTVLAGGQKGGKIARTDEERGESRKREALRLKRELKNVNAKENNRNFERMFIGENVVDVGTTRVNNATGAGKMDDDNVEDDDEDNRNNDAKKGWYYPCDWTLKTRATFAKICSLHDNDTNDEAEEDFDEDDDFEDEEKRKIQTFLSSSSVSKSFSWVNDERGANAIAAGAHDAFSTHGVNGIEPLSSKNCSFFYCLPSSSNSILSSESNKNDSRRSAAMQRATISFQYPDSRLPAHAIDKMNISFNNNKDLKSSSAATNAWFRQRSNQWTEALSSAYGRLRSYFSYSFYVAYEDRRIFFACPGLDGSFSSNSFKQNNNTKDDDDDVNDKNDDKNNNISQGFAVITNTNQKLRDILTKNGIPFKPVFVTRDGKGFSVNDNRTKSDKMKNNKHLLFGGDANLFDVDDDDEEEKENDDEGEEEGEDNDEDDDDGKENAERENKKANLQQSSQEEGNDGDKVKDDVKDEGEEDGCDDGYITNVVGKENSVKKKKNDDALLKNAIHPTFIDAWNESKRKIKLKEEQEKNKVFERFTRDGAILVRGTLAVHGLVNVLLQFRGQDPGDVKVTEQTVMDAEALALARMNTFAANTTTNNTNTTNNTKNLTTTKAGSSTMISSDVGVILAPRPFANCFTKSFKLRPNKVAVASETSKSKLMRLWTLDLGSNNNSNNNNTSDSYSKKKNKMMMRTTNSDRKNWCDPCDLIPPWTMARVCRVLSAEDDFFGSNDNERDDDAMMDDKSIANEDDDKQKKKKNKNKNNNTVKQNILRENKNSIRLWLDTDPCSKVLNASVAAARLMSEESFSRRLRSTTKAAQHEKPEDEKKVCPPLKPRDEAFGDEDEKRWAFSFSSNRSRNRANDFAAKSNNNDTGIVQSLELKKKALVLEVACARSWK